MSTARAVLSALGLGEELDVCRGGGKGGAGRRGELGCDPTTNEGAGPPAYPVRENVGGLFLFCGTKRLDKTVSKC